MTTRSEPTEITHHLILQYADPTSNTGHLNTLVTGDKLKITVASDLGISRNA